MQKLYFFLDWCPVSYAENTGQQISDSIDVPKSDFAEIEADRIASGLRIFWDRRSDGILLFAIEFSKDVSSSNAVVIACRVSEILKEKSYRHHHFYHFVGGKESGSAPLPRLYSHNPVLIEEPTEHRFLRRVKKYVADATTVGSFSTEWEKSKQRRSLEIVITAILKEDSILSLLRAKKISGNEITEHLAFSRLQHLLARKRDEFFDYIEVERLGVVDKRLQSGLVGVTCALITYGFVFQFISLMGTVDSSKSNSLSYLFSGGISLIVFICAVYFTHDALYYRPLRNLVRDTKGFISAAAIYGSSAQALANRASHKLKHDLKNYEIAEPFHWTLSSIEPVVEYELEKQQSRLTIFQIFITVLAAVFTILAFLVIT